MTAIGLRRGADIAARLVDVGVRIVRLSRRIARDSVSRHIAMQLLRSGTSAGANYEEARGAESRADFIHKLRIATKELRESIYWLRLVHRAELVADDLRPLASELEQVCAILAASARTARESAL